MSSSWPRRRVPVTGILKTVSPAHHGWTAGCSCDIAQHAGEQSSIGFQPVSVLNVSRRGCSILAFLRFVCKGIFLASCPNPPRRPSSSAVFRMIRAKHPPLVFSIHSSSILANRLDLQSRTKEDDEDEDWEMTLNRYVQSVRAEAVASPTTLSNCFEGRARCEQRQAGKRFLRDWNGS